jgi:hypothetical protein
LILGIAHRRCSEDVGRMRVRGKANIGRDGSASAAVCAQNDTVPDPLITGTQGGPSVSLTIDHQTGLSRLLQDHSESLSSAVFVADQKRQTERGQTK